MLLLVGQREVQIEQKISCSLSSTVPLSDIQGEASREPEILPWPHRLLACIANYNYYCFCLGNLLRMETLVHPYTESSDSKDDDESNKQSSVSKTNGTSNVESSDL